MVKGAKTIAQYKILEWVSEYFEPNTVKVVFDHADRAVVTDRDGDRLKVEYIPGVGIEWEAIAPEKKEEPQISPERIEELETAWNESALMDDDEYREWYEDLTPGEQALIDAWDKEYAKGMLRLCEDILEREAPQADVPKTDAPEPDPDWEWEAPPTVVPAKGLPEGWVWRCYSDASGSLVSPEGWHRFSYDQQPYHAQGGIEYQDNRDGSQWHVYWGDFDQFREAMESKVTEELQRNAQAEQTQDFEFEM